MLLENSPMSVITTSQRFQVTAINDRQVGDWEALNLALVAQIGESGFDITIKRLTGESIEPKSTYRVSLASWSF